MTDAQLKDYFDKAYASGLFKNLAEKEKLQYFFHVGFQLAKVSQGSIPAGEEGSLERIMQMALTAVGPKAAPYVLGVGILKEILSMFKKKKVDKE